MAQGVSRRGKTASHTDQVPAYRSLDEAYWTRFGSNPEPSMREKILIVTVDDVGRVGPSAFNAKVVCEALGVSFSLINHYFGSRDELIAEAAIRSYQYYVDSLWAAARSKKKPEERLRAWLERSLSWSRQYSGLGALLNYPTASLDVTHIITEKWSDTLKAWGTVNLARLLQLVKDVRSGKVTDIEIDVDNIPKANLLKDARANMAMASVGWAILGLAVWSAGKHLPTGGIDETKPLEKIAIEYHLKTILDIAKNG